MVYLWTNTWLGLVLNLRDILKNYNCVLCFFQGAYFGVFEKIQLKIINDIVLVIFEFYTDLQRFIKGDNPYQFEISE